MSAETSSVREMEGTKAFWNANPCGMHGGFDEQRAQRYGMEPWLPAVLAAIAATGPGAMLEVGCGQGVDSIELCAMLPATTRYVGIDYSEASVATATANAASQASRLKTRPHYQVGNAQALPFADGEFDVVYSMGVIHHTHDEFAAMAEIRRVLKPGGVAYLALYRKPSLKVGAAQLLRGLQKGLDRILGTDRCVYGLLRRMGTSSRIFGTMFHECFGVPYLKWYNRAEIYSLFSGFSNVSLKIYGPNFGVLAPRGDAEIKGGYFWFISAVK